MAFATEMVDKLTLPDRVSIMYENFNFIPEI